MSAVSIFPSLQVQGAEEGVSQPGFALNDVEVSWSWGWGPSQPGSSSADPEHPQVPSDTPLTEVTVPVCPLGQLVEQQAI